MRNEIILWLSYVFISFNLISCNSHHSITHEPRGTAFSEPTQDTITPVKSSLVFKEIGLDKIQAEEILQNVLAGRLITNGETYPQSFFTEYTYDQQNHLIYFFLPVDSFIINYLKKYPRVSFVVDRYNEWSWGSVHIFGEALVVKEDQKNEQSVKVTITPELITGRLGESLYQPFKKLPCLVLNQRHQIIPVPVDFQKNWTNWETDPLPDLINVKFERPASEIAESYLRRHSAGRVNTIGLDYPYSVPLNFAYFDNKIYFHSKKENSLKIKNITANQNVSFSIEWFGNELPWTDICVSGKARIIDRYEEMYACMQKMSVVLGAPDGKLPDNYTPPEMKASGGHGSRAGGFGGMIVIEITPELLTITRKNISGPALLKIPWVNITE
ncbi:MAG: pyridoxamine 5'-phosphate oxidase family protein [Planctomycetota bacterium]